MNRVDGEIREGDAVAVTVDSYPAEWAGRVHQVMISDDGNRSCIVEVPFQVHESKIRLIVPVEDFIAAKPDPSIPPEVMLINGVTLQPVKSSNIAAVGFCVGEDGAGTLYVQFCASGVTYSYHGVPPDVHADLMSADSKGKFFLSHIREQYPFQKVTP